MNSRDRFSIKLGEAKKLLRTHRVNAVINLAKDPKFLLTERLPETDPKNIVLHYIFSQYYDFLTIILLAKFINTSSEYCDRSGENPKNTLERKIGKNNVARVLSLHNNFKENQKILDDKSSKLSKKREAAKNIKNIWTTIEEEIEKEEVLDENQKTTANRFLQKQQKLLDDKISELTPSLYELLEIIKDTTKELGKEAKREAKGTQITPEKLLMLHKFRKKYEKILNSKENSEERIKAAMALEKFWETVATHETSQPYKRELDICLIKQNEYREKARKLIKSKYSNRNKIFSENEAATFAKRLCDMEQAIHIELTNSDSLNPDDIKLNLDERNEHPQKNIEIPRPTETTPLLRN